MNLLSYFLLILIVLYGFAVMVGRVKELNNLLRRLFGSLFHLLLDVIAGILGFILEQLHQLHHRAYARSPLITVLVD